MSRRLTVIIDELLDREGGYVDHADDKGGATMYGITEQVARLHGWDGKMQYMPKTLAVQIYKDQYWSAPNFDRVAMINQRIAEELLDTGVNMGVAVAAKMLQRSLNALNSQESYYADMLVDGIVGNTTLGALKHYLDRRQHHGEDVLMKALNCLQGARYITISEARERNESFLYGWLHHRIHL
ncbi:glycoside hydrolase family 108 protein [Marinobacter salarius]|uniref:glycoside hydrolase family 108 protein n=1 Tax=Marinobacter salarius TaxID=1420917 RepID=UPI003BA885BF